VFKEINNFKKTTLKMKVLEDYENIINNRLINQIKARAKKLDGKKVLHINSNNKDGGVAEILHSLVPLMNNLNIDTEWKVIGGPENFFMITKKFHNSLQGEEIDMSKINKKLYVKNNQDFSTTIEVDYDYVIVHDPQPLPLIKFFKKEQPWIWRCHVDLSNPNKQVWSYLKGFIKEYNCMIISKKGYKTDGIKLAKRIFYPAIDPLSEKNKELPEKKVNAYLKKFGVEKNKPIITQVSRFDKWKDPLGVIKVFEKIREKEKCQLILMGSFATDDPEAVKIYEEVKKRVKKSRHEKDIKIIRGGKNVMYDNDLAVNAIQSASDVIIQKSLKEGFGLIVSEALYKKTPVVASDVGGISLQVVNGVNGFLHEPNDINGFSKSVMKLLKNEKLRREFGKKGKEHIIENFLITRLLLNYLDLLNSLTKVN